MPASAAIVFTRHALERMRQRQITQAMVIAAVEAPDRRQPEDDGDTRFVRTINGRQVQVVCAPVPHEAKWLVKSVWVRGEADPKPTLFGRLIGIVARWFRR